MDKRYGSIYSRIQPQPLKIICDDILAEARERESTFVETIELQFLLNYDPYRDKRFCITTVLPHKVRFKRSVIVIGDQVHLDQAKDLGVPYADVGFLLAFGKNRKLIKKWARQYHTILCSTGFLRQVPRIMGPQLNKMGKFPKDCPYNVPLSETLDRIDRTMCLILKKTRHIATPIGHVRLTTEQIMENIYEAITSLMEILRKRWLYIDTIYLKSSMGSPHRLYPKIASLLPPREFNDTEEISNFEDLGDYSEVSRENLGQLQAGQL